MKPIRTLSVTPSLPPALDRLGELAHNLRWAWNHATIELFRRLDGDLWESTGHNPVLMLGTIDQAQLQTAAADEGFLSHLQGVSQHLDLYRQSVSTWFRRIYGPTDGPLVGYFSAEFGITECLSIFAGGLGVLAGDHLKSSSDLGIPLVAVGLLYQQGYCRQCLNQAGWQQETYRDNDFHNLPITVELGPDGNPLVIDIPLPDRTVVANVWRAQVGRVPLYLLDTNLPGNRPDDRDITDQLYGGDLELRIKQEIVLGIGGYRALQKLGIQPPVYHMNEGHAAFLSLERTRQLMEQHSLTFAEAREAASAGLLFTTHTPVAAGHDYFPPYLMDRYLSDYARSLGLTRQEFLGFGRQNPMDDNESFCMTVLALRMAARSNGVSKLHGQVSRTMWQGIWPGVPEDEIPIEHVTNGVHFRSWISKEMNQIYDRYLGPRWQDEPANEELWQRVERIPAEELWRTHERRRERLVSFTRRRLRERFEKSGASQAEIESADGVLDSECLTIGFARRFATYKRATLLLRDPERLARLLNNPERPVQIIFAGMAHPRDDAGKELIRQIVDLSRKDQFRRRLVFLEGYDVAVARYLVQGADVWLNTPRRPQEASGTSGMKAAANGALNLSTLDGWWDEAWQRSNYASSPIGWAIGRGEVYSNTNEQDQVESEALYNLLERDVIPTFYDRGPDGLPRRWIWRMKNSIQTLCHFFNTHRMVRQYTDDFYMWAATRYAELTADDMARARELAGWKTRLAAAWPRIHVQVVDDDQKKSCQVGDLIHVRARISLGDLTPHDVAVELYLGRVDADGDIVGADTQPMQQITSLGTPGEYEFETIAVPCSRSGLHGYTVRVIPRHRDLATLFLPGLITWASSDQVPALAT